CVSTREAVLVVGADEQKARASRGKDSEFFGEMRPLNSDGITLPFGLALRSALYLKVQFTVDDIRIVKDEADRLDVPARAAAVAKPVGSLEDAGARCIGDAALARECARDCEFRQARFLG